MSVDYVCHIGFGWIIPHDVCQALNKEGFEDNFMFINGWADNDPYFIGKIFTETWAGDYTELPSQINNFYYDFDNVKKYFDILQTCGIADPIGTLGFPKFYIINRIC